MVVGTAVGLAVMAFVPAADPVPAGPVHAAAPISAAASLPEVSSMPVPGSIPAVALNRSEAASLHTDLEWSVPPDSSVVGADLAQIHLRFTTTVEPAYTSLTVIGPNGEEVEAGELDPVAGTEEFEYRLPLEGPLQAGMHRAAWRTVGTDGHPVEGSFVFTVETQEDAGPAAETTADATGDRLPDEAREGEAADTAAADDAGIRDVRTPPATAAFRPDAPLPVVVRWAGYIALLLLIGASTFRLAVLQRAGAADSPPGLPAGLYGRAVERARVLALVALGLSLLTLPVRLWIRSTLLHGSEAAWDGAALRTLLASTTWGTGWLLQAGALVLIAVGLVLAGQDRSPGGRSPATGERPGWQWAALREAAGRVGWEVALVGTILLAAAAALSGHAVGVERLRWLSVAIHTGHVLAAGVWLGTLAMLLFAGIPAALGLPEGGRWEGVARLAYAFSPVALLGAGLLLLTGVVNSLFHISSFGELWRTSYGNVLLLKLAVLSGVALTGLYNWKRVLPRLRSRQSRSGLRRSAKIELGIALVVLLVTAILAALPTP